MASIFSTPPPHFTTGEISDFISNTFNINGDVIDLYSDRDQNFLIHPDVGETFILKVFNPTEILPILDLQTQATQFIHQHNKSLQVPLDIGNVKSIEKDGNKYLLKRVTYLKGNFLKDQQLGSNAYKQLGIFLGNLSHALYGFSHPAADRPFEWDIRTIDLIESRCSYLKSSAEQKTIFHFLNEYIKVVIPLRNKLRMSIIHNDGNDHNVLVDDGGKTRGIIDFGDMVFSYQCAEIAVCMAYVGLDKTDPISSMVSVLKGYHSIFPLNKSELKALIYLVSIRLCISVTMSAWRTVLFPDNKYLSTSQESAWAFLNKLEKEKLVHWESHFIELGLNSVK